MKRYLITGCAGFIGSNFVYYMLNKYKDIHLVNLDKLTCAGNLENLKGVEGDSRHVFVQGDICDRELVSSLFEKYDFDYVINFAAESHVDRSITNPEIFVETNVLGTVNLLQCAKNAWYKDGQWAQGKKYLQVSTDEVYGSLGEEGYFMETTPLCPHSPYSSSKASADMFVMAFHDTYGMPVNITCGMASGAVDITGPAFTAANAQVQEEAVAALTMQMCIRDRFVHRATHRCVYGKRCMLRAQPAPHRASHPESAMRSGTALSR